MNIFKVAGFCALALGVLLYFVALQSKFSAGQGAEHGAIRAAGKVVRIIAAASALCLILAIIFFSLK